MASIQKSEVKILSPKIDLVFKILFCKKPESLRDLLNSILGFKSGRKVTEVEILNPEILPEESKKKFIILDILAKDSSGKKFNIEMQARKYDFYPQRILYYWSKAYTSELGSGKKYDLLKPVIGIHFLNYRFFPRKNSLKNSSTKKEFFYGCFRLRDDDHPELRLSDDLEIHVLELPRLKKKSYGDLDDFHQWCHFFNHIQNMDEETMEQTYSNPKIKDAFYVLQEMSADQKLKMRVRDRENALREEASALGEYLNKGFEKGEKKGKLEGKLEEKKEMVEKLLEQNMSWDFIEKVSGLNRTSYQELLSSFSSSES